VTVQGFTGSPSIGTHDGVLVDGNNTRISSSGSDVNVTGVGTGSSALSSRLSGVRLISSGEITAGGSGNVTVHGTGGMSASSFNNGVVLVSSSRITSSGGDVSVTGLGGGSGATQQNYGVYVQTASEITAGGSGRVTVQGTGGTATGDFNSGVFIQTANTRITSSGGDVRVVGIEGAGPSGTGLVVVVGSITTATNGGNITLVTNSINLSSPVITNSNSSVTVLPYTNGVAITLGAFGSIGGPLGLSNTTLNNISTGTLIIGDANSGNLTVSSTITRSVATDVELRSGGDVTFSAGGFNTSGGTLLLAPGASLAAIKTDLRQYRCYGNYGDFGRRPGHRHQWHQPRFGLPPIDRYG
jgi:hypothetical protein